MKYGDWRAHLRYNLVCLKDRVLAVITLGLGRGIIYQVPAPPRQSSGKALPVQQSARRK